MWIRAIAILLVCLAVGGGQWSARPASAATPTRAADGWSTAMLSEARSRPTPATVGSKVLFAGGCVRSCGHPRGWVTTSQVDIYDSSSGTWSTANLREPRDGMATATVGSQVLFAGGGVANQRLSDVVDIYEDATGEWSVAHLAEPRLGMTVATVGSTVLFAGGSVLAKDYDGGAPSSMVDVYDASTGRWSTAHLARPYFTPSSVTVGHRVLIASGGLVDIYDSVTRGWSTVRLRDERDGSAMVSVGRQVLVAGGAKSATPPGSGWTYFRTVDVYDDATRSWSTARLSEARANVAVAVVGTQAVIAGGDTEGRDGHRASAAVDVYDSSTGAWSAATMAQGRWPAIVATAGSQVLVVGCSSVCGGRTSDVDLYDAASHQWSHANSLSWSSFPWVPVSLGGQALFVGYADSGAVDWYDSADGTWGSADLSEVRSNFAIGSVGTQVLIAGGVHGSEPTATVDIYDAATARDAALPIDAEP